MLSYFSLFLLVFDLAIPPIKFIGSAPFSLLISVLFILSAKRPIRKEVQEFSSPLFFIYFIILLFVVFRVIFSGEVGYLLSTLKSFLIFLSAIAYIIAFGISDINDKLINIFFVNGLICFIAGSFPEVLALVNFFKIENHEIGSIVFRNSFLSGSGYFGISSIYAIIILLCGYKLVNDGASLSFLIKFLVILLAGVIAGRTAFIGVAVAFFYVVTKSIKYSILSILLVCSLVIIILSNSELSVYSSWIFEFIKINGGSISFTSTSSTDELSRMYFLPQELLTYIVGDGRYVEDGKYYMGTDAGYMRNLFFGGIPFVIFVIIYACFFAYKSKNAFFWFFMLPLAFLLHYKGVFILNNPASVPVFTLLSFWLFHCNRLKKS
ncbi:hypothetical protein [Edwardsiella tarda]|uniref:hypothetical protein n=1 Tax=Edwardsiella tarda TaxID=636 RepID=UPI003F657F5A